MKVLFDLDGVIRDLCKEEQSKNPPKSWDEPFLATGEPFIQYVDNHLEKLFSSPPTKYHPIISKLENIELLSCQPETWRENTTKWINKYLPNAVSVLYVKHPEDKLTFLGNNTLLVEDYPLFSDYSKIILIDRSYNQNVNICFRRIHNPDELQQLLNTLCIK